jgi:hypothetical protein
VPYANESRLAEWRREIAKARIKLADSSLLAQRRDLWTVVDCREACIQISGADFPAQLELIDREIEGQLRPRRRTA